MSADADIRAALADLPPVSRGFRRWIVVGQSAGQSLAAVECQLRGEVAGNPDWSAVMPKTISGVSVIATDQFPGWSIVDRPRSALDSAVASTA